MDVSLHKLAVRSSIGKRQGVSPHRTTHLFFGIKDSGGGVIFPGPYEFHAIARSLTRCRPSQSVCVPGCLAFVVERIT